MLTFIERHGIDVETLVKHNVDRLRQAAEARGHNHGFIRETPTGKPGEVTKTQEYHVFPGEELLVPDTDSNDKKTSSPHGDGGESHVED